MVMAGVVDDVDYLVGHHLYSGMPTGTLTIGGGGYFATRKFDALLTGSPAHAGGQPHGGHNALLAAANAVLNLYAIPRHGDGATRINVGRLNAGTGRNVICPMAQLVVETRGATSALSDYMYAAAQRVLASSAAMYGCELEIRPMGEAQSADSDPALSAQVRHVAEAMGGVRLEAPEGSGGSEDFTYMMRRVQDHGGLATTVGIGADLGGWGHHTARFDFDEQALKLATTLLASVALALPGEHPVGGEGER
jgi:aminobenzoyl-glutamate utilization protein A